MTNKTCTQCNQTKPLEEFPKDKNRSDGRYPWCKACTAAKRSAYAEAYPERVKASKAKYYREHQPEIRAQIDRLDAERKARDPERVRAQGRERSRRYGERHPERVREMAKRYRQENPGKVYAQLVERRERQRRAPGAGYTADEFAELCRRFGNRCLCCGERGALTADHIVPLSCGGADDISNIQPLCRSCNARKGNQTIDYRAGHGTAQLSG